MEFGSSLVTCRQREVIQHLALNLYNESVMFLPTLSVARQHGRGIVGDRNIRISQELDP